MDTWARTPRRHPARARGVSTDVRTRRRYPTSGQGKLEVLAQRRRLQKGVAGRRGRHLAAAEARERLAGYLLAARRPETRPRVDVIPRPGVGGMPGAGLGRGPR